MDLHKYIQKNNAELYAIIQDVDPDNYILSQRRIKNGITFLMPNQEYTSYMQETLDQSDDDVIDILRSMVITDYLQSPSEWNYRKHEIANLHNRQVSVNSIDGRHVYIDDSVKITMDRKFNCDTCIIYNIVEGRLTKGGAKINKRKKKTSNTKKSDKSKSNPRAAIYTLVLQSTDVYRSCLNYCSSFIQYLAKNKHTDVLESIVYFLDYCPLTTFMILFEPGKGARYFVDSMLINNWFSDGITFPRNPQSIFTKLLKSVKYTNTVAIRESVQDTRENLLELRIPKELVSGMDSIYNNLVSNNSINDIDNVLPPLPFNYMKKLCDSQYNLKLVQDEIRCVVSTLLEEGERHSTVLKECYSSLRFLPRFNDQDVASAQSRSAVVSNITGFVNTTYFLYLTPTDTGCFGGEPGYYTSYSPANDKIIDPVVAKMDALKTIKNNSTNPNEIVESIKYMIDNGEKLPPELYELAQQLTMDNI